MKCPFEVDSGVLYRTKAVQEQYNSFYRKVRHIRH
ncbi:hypothetical protein TcasGA2_TC002543 [Tribolium castaneum]|uniref:Uncharacterized protein n=1 Tax=Tribolium castaneum TaxID=7070 RepID=D6WG01_TRICA|nr:hypothetical protein TcasGA2_TC002543 [Tribolium castaneum]